MIDWYSFGIGVVTTVNGLAVLFHALDIVEAME